MSHIFLLQVEHGGLRALLKQKSVRSGQSEPTTSAFVASAKKNPMTIETDRLREDFRESMKSLPIGLPEYSTDPIIQRRVGRLLATYGSAQPAWAAIADLPPNNNGNETERAGSMVLRAPLR